MQIVGVPTFTVGDKVRFGAENAARFPGVYTVTTVNKVNLKVTSQDGMRRVSVHPMYLVRATDDEVQTSWEIPLPEHFVIGETVRVKGRPDSEVYVVLKPTPKGYSCALIGGNGDRYLNVPVQLLSHVKIEWSVAE